MAEGENPRSRSRSRSRSQSQSQPQWCSLPPEILVTISSKIADVADFVRFRCVCKPWRSATKPQDLSPQAQLPWLLLSYDRRSSSRSFFRLSTRSVITLDLPETRNRIICGSSNGWFLLLGPVLKYSLFNPFTRSLIHLPSIPIPAGFVKTNNCLKLHRKRIPLEGMVRYFGCRAYITSSDPHSAVDGVVIFKHNSSSTPQVRYWRPGDEDWSTFDWGLHDFSPRAFYKGKIYAMDHDGCIATCDVGSEAVVVPSLKLSRDCRLRFFLPLPDDLLVISCALEIYPSTLCTFRSRDLECHRLVESEGTMAWSRLEGVGDYTVFLTNDWYPGQAKLISAVRGAPGYKTNRFYYVVPRNDGRRRQDQQLSGEDIFILEHDTCFERSCGGPSMELRTSSWISPSIC